MSHKVVFAILLSLLGSSAFAFPPVPEDKKEVQPQKPSNDYPGMRTDLIKTLGLAPQLPEKRDQREVIPHIKERFSDIYAEYNLALKHDASLRGSVMFEIAVEPEGSVSRCTIIEREGELGDLSNKICGMVSELKFRPHTHSKTSVFRFPMSFKPG